MKRVESTATGSMQHAMRVLNGDGVEAVHPVECEDDPEAILKGTIFMDSQPAHLEAEIWRGDRLLARIPRRQA